MSHKSTSFEERVAAKEEITKVNLPRAHEADVEARAEVSRDTVFSLLGVIEVSGLSLFTESTFPKPER